MNGEVNRNHVTVDPLSILGCPPGVQVHTHHQRGMVQPTGEQGALQHLRPVGECGQRLVGNGLKYTVTHILHSSNKIYIVTNVC